jgi:hypothetical protein
MLIVEPRNSPRPEESMLRNEINPMVPVGALLSRENNESLSNFTVQLFLDNCNDTTVPFFESSSFSRPSVTPAGNPLILAVNVAITPPDLDD